MFSKLSNLEISKIIYFLLSFHTFTSCIDSFFSGILGDLKSIPPFIQ